eukprot:4649885-Pyramimonas_sp.AAC.1
MIKGGCNRDITKNPYVPTKHSPQCPLCSHFSLDKGAQFIHLRTHLPRQLLQPPRGIRHVAVRPEAAGPGSTRPSRRGR